MTAFSAKPGRIPCVVLGCRRTGAADRYPPDSTLICGKCFRLAPVHLRRRVRRLERIMKRLGVTGLRDSKPGTPGRQAAVLHWKTWDRIVKAATEAKVGIG
jgi:hypothetical protein